MRKKTYSSKIWGLVENTSSGTGQSAVFGDEAQQLYEPWQAL